MSLPELPPLPELSPVPTSPNLRLSLEERLSTTRALIDSRRLTMDAAIDCYIIISEEFSMLQSFEPINQTLYFQITDLLQTLEQYFGARVVR